MAHQVQGDELEGVLPQLAKQLNFSAKKPRHGCLARRCATPSRLIICRPGLALNNQ